MNGRDDPGYPGYGNYPRAGSSPWVDPLDTATDWFTPVQPAQTRTAVGVLDRPQPQQYPTQEHPTIPPGTLDITPEDIYEALGPNAQDVLSTAEIDVDEVIRQINAETTVLPPLVIPDHIPESELGEQPPAEVVEAVTAWKRRFLKGAVAGVLLTLTSTGGAAAAMDKSVTVEVDGQEHSVNTYQSTVGEVLQNEGIDIGEHDALSPSPQADVGHGDTITLDRGRLLTINVDGQERQEWVRSVTVDQALRQLQIPTEGAKLSADRGMAVPEGGMELTVKTAKNITVVDGGNGPRELTTHAVDVDELVQQENLQLGPQDQISGGGEGGKLTDGAEIRIDRTGSSVVPETQPVDPPTKEIVDPTMFKGEERVEKPGKPGEKVVFTRITEENGQEVGREVVEERVTKEATPEVVRVGGKEPPNSGVWDKLVECEATGDWSMNSGNGYYGGLQFDKSTWDAHGGDEFAQYPHQASREQQIQVAEQVRDERGGSYGAWPSCSSELGLS